MPQLDIAPEDRKAIATVKTLTPSVLDKFISALKSAKPVAHPHDMAEQIAGRVPMIPEDSIRRMLETLYTLYYIRDLSGVRPAPFLDDLMDAAIRSSELHLSPDDVRKLRSMLERLLNIETLKIVAKASRLQRDGERLYCASKILSDIRPVFKPNPSVQPEGAVITHTLKVGYHEGRDHVEIQIVLDSNDLDKLAEVVRRAQMKDKTLRSFLKRSKLENLGD